MQFLDQTSTVVVAMLSGKMAAIDIATSCITRDVSDNTPRTDNVVHAQHTESMSDVVLSHDVEYCLLLLAEQYCGVWSGWP